MIYAAPTLLRSALRSSLMTSPKEAQTARPLHL